MNHAVGWWGDWRRQGLGCCRGGSGGGEVTDGPAAPESGRRRSAPNGLSLVHPRPWLIDTPRDVCTHIAYIASTISRVIHHQFQIRAINVSAKVKYRLRISADAVSRRNAFWFPLVISGHKTNIMSWKYLQEISIFSQNYSKWRTRKV